MIENNNTYNNSQEQEDNREGLVREYEAEEQERKRQEQKQFQKDMEERATQVKEAQDAELQTKIEEFYRDSAPTKKQKYSIAKDGTIVIEEDKEEDPYKFEKLEGEFYRTEKEYDVTLGDIQSFLNVYNNDATIFKEQPEKFPYIVEQYQIRDGREFFRIMEQCLVKSKTDEKTGKTKNIYQPKLRYTVGINQHFIKDHQNNRESYVGMCHYDNIHNKTIANSRKFQNPDRTKETHDLLTGVNECINNFEKERTPVGNPKDNKERSEILGLEKELKEHLKNFKKYAKKENKHSYIFNEQGKDYQYYQQNGQWYFRCGNSHIISFNEHRIDVISSYRGEKSNEYDWNAYKKELTSLTSELTNIEENINMRQKKKK